MFEIIESIIDWDKSALLYINGMHNTFFDGFMYWISDKWIWIPLYVSLLWPIIKRKSWGTIPVAVCLFLCVLFADQFASGLCKPLFQRFRPSYDEEIGAMVHIVAGGRGGAYGFISSHAANTFAVATFTILLFRNKWQGLVISLWALLNCYSRMYLGYHFPMDLICGGIAGIAVGFICWGIYLAILKIWPERLKDKALCERYGGTAFETVDFYPFIAVFILSLFYFSIFASKGFIV